jgi:hypothetical protein
MPLQAKVVQADLRGSNKSLIDDANEEFNNWLENDAPGAPVDQSSLNKARSRSNESVFVNIAIVSY